MQTIILKVDDNIYEDVLALLKNLSKKGVIIENKTSQVKIKKLKEFLKKNKVKAFKDIDDAVKWQRDIRSEWE